MSINIELLSCYIATGFADTGVTSTSANVKKTLCLSIYESAV